MNAAGMESGFSEEVNATPNDIIEVPIDAISGTVFDLELLDSGRLDQYPIDSATVELFVDDVLVKSVTTTTSGVFEFSDLEGENVTYDVRVRVIGTVPETGEKIEVNMVSRDANTGGYYELLLPRTLASQKLSLVYKLDHLKIKSDLLFGLLPPLSLSQSYDESQAKALIATWLADIDDNAEAINTSLARLMLAEMVLASMYDNATKMSHETGEALLELVVAFHTTYEVFNIIVKALDESGTPKILYQKLAEQIANLYVYLFLERPSSLLESRLPGWIGPSVASGLRAMNAAATSNTTERGASFIESIVEDQLKNLIVTQMDDILLSYSYVQPRTQEYLDQAVANAESFNYQGEHIAAYAASQTVVNQSTFETDEVHAKSELLQEIGSISGKISDITILASAIPGVQVLGAVGALLKSVQLSTLISAAGISASQLRNIQQNEVAHGMQLAFNPGASKVGGKQRIESTLAFAKKSGKSDFYQAKLLDLVEDYIQLLDDIIELARSGEHEEVITKINELLQADDALASAFLIAEAPVYAAAEQAIQQIEGFEDADMRLNTAITATTTERILLYTRLLEYSLAPSNQADSLIAQVEITTQVVENAVNAITEIDELISDVAAPPLLVVKKHGIINTGQGVVLRANIKNIGAVTAENITVVLIADSSSTFFSESQLSIVGLEADAEQIVDWELQITDSTRTFSTYVIEIASSNAKSLSTSGIFSIATAGIPTTLDDRTALIPSEYKLEQNYPNPFNSSTRIAYTLPEAHRVTLTIYDALGRAVRVLVDEFKPAGHHTVTFDGKGSLSGLYFYTIQAGSFRKTRSLILLK
ncbi:MAG: T9SS type A sorting domain-containing protein [Rhodothermales bacterium]